MTRKREKIVGGYNEPNLVKIEGKGRPAVIIYETYLEYIQAKNFSVTTEEIADYLRASYQYVTENILEKVLHIRINDSARSIIIKTLRSEDRQDDELFSLVLKRILFQRDSFEKYILANARYECTYRRIYRTDFDEEVFSSIKTELYRFNAGRKKTITLEQLLQAVMNSFVPKDFEVEPIYKPLSSFPSKLFSQRDLMEQLGFPYKVNFYRYVDRVGLNKVKIGNLVRYLATEVEDDDYLCWIYEEIYQKLPKEQMAFSLKIKEKALDILKMLR